MYLLDANVFIDAKRRYYSFTVCPGFWEWLDLAFDSGNLGSIQKIREELIGFGDALSEWARRRPNFFFDPDSEVVRRMSAVAEWVPPASTRSLLTLLGGGRIASKAGMRLRGLVPGAHGRAVLPQSHFDQ